MQVVRGGHSWLQDTSDGMVVGSGQFRWSDADVAFEYTGEIRRIREAYAVGNVGNIRPGRLQGIECLEDPVAHDEFLKRHVVHLFEGATELR